MNYDFEPLNPYRERLIDREDWALAEAERIWYDIHDITSIFELKSSCCPDLVVSADIISLGLRSIIAELAAEKRRGTTVSSRSS